MKWKYFCGACLVVGGALLKAGAPLFAIIAGIAFAAVMNTMRQRGQAAPRAPRSKAMAKAR
jgi:hypothetical protein